MPKQPRAFVAWLLGAAVIVGLDQWTKVYFDSTFTYGQRLPVLSFFDFTLLYNPGAAFSFLSDGQGWQRWLFTVIAVGAIVLILHLLWRSRNQYLFCAALMAILGGAIGNLIDRVQHGHVVDFLLFYWQQWHFPAFNIADVSITVGAVLLILDEIRRIRRQAKKDHG
ncbi:signal peptidase II [Neopusillimonas maritima]|jgi:signal peptidase II|uniref:Lipoprotein signal peptidase n=1 Tax=Neopusillimonas maritima TaxID=2026239 RepID=A0ABX9MYX5_9BURK|nr:signal peptidase II [Neopusillimonas maritima]MAL01289.1 signal peptidase II [Alcaligenaceae bacterium]RII83753.1 signal peptidase II [Neopusillimonas maritima]